MTIGIYHIRYLDLIQNTEQEVKNICNYIGINFMNKMLTGFNSPSIQDKIVRPIEFWKAHNREKITDKSQKKKIQ